MARSPEKEIATLRAELRAVSRAIKRGAATQKRRYERQGQIIECLVDQHGITQAEVARDIGVTRMAVGDRLMKLRTAEPRTSV